MAREGGVPADRVLNAMTLPEITRYLRQKRRSLPGWPDAAAARVLVEGTVTVAADRGHHFRKPPQNLIELVEGNGVEGDAHAGALSGIAI
jgi:hypothetical protein